jgi:hypothetical protein
MGSHDPLRNLKVASPCPANWEEMYGDDRVRFCGQCRLNVYNLSGMSRVEAERLLASTEGRLCVRFYRRKDGTVLTRDCPVGLAAARRRIAKVASAVAGFVFGALAGTGATLALRDDAPAGAGYERTMGTIASPENGEVVGALAPSSDVVDDVGPVTGVRAIPRRPDASRPTRPRRAAAR